jgi:hypothetical protein
MWRRFALLTATVVGVSIVSLSARIAVWWGAVGHGGSWAPQPLMWLLAHRPDAGEADVHVVMWFAVACAAAMAVRSVRHRVFALGLVWLFGALVEVAQAAFSTRSAQWGDLVGNTVGVAVAMAVVFVASKRRADGRHIERASRQAVSGGVEGSGFVG